MYIHCQTPLTCLPQVLLPRAARPRRGRGAALPLPVRQGGDQHGQRQLRGHRGGRRVDQEGVRIETISLTPPVCIV